MGQNFGRWGVVVVGGGPPPLIHFCCVLYCKTLGNMHLTYPDPPEFVPSNLQIYLGWPLDAPPPPPMLGQILKFYQFLKASLS